MHEPREYENALQWLVDARLVHKIYRSSAPGLPIAAYDDLSAFKIYLVDVGIRFAVLAQLAPTAFAKATVFLLIQRRITENFVLQTLITQFEVMPRSLEPEQPTLRSGFPHSVGERHLSRGGQIRSQHNQQEYEEVQGTVP